jgi:hypothetical protein
VNVFGSTCHAVRGDQDHLRAVRRVGQKYTLSAFLNTVQTLEMGARLLGRAPPLSPGSIEHLRYDARADGHATLADGESQRLVERHRGGQLNAHLHAVAWQHQFRTDQGDRTGDVAGSEEGFYRRSG